MPYARYTPDEVAERGEALYEKDIRSKVEGRHRGEFLVLDIETGDYEIAPDDVAATKCLLGRNTKAVVYGLRIGEADAYHMRSVSRAIAGDMNGLMERAREAIQAYIEAEEEPEISVGFAGYKAV